MKYYLLQDKDGRIANYITMSEAEADWKASRLVKNKLLNDLEFSQEPNTDEMNVLELNISIEGFRRITTIRKMINGEDIEIVRYR